jgi:dipeptidyl aminopeptidase/acylaminoacyl peptidase
MPKKRVIRAEDLYRIQLITDCRVSPNGLFVAYTVQRVDEKTKRKYTDLWIASTRGGTPRQFTYGDWSDTSPRWSPDGTTIAIISNRTDENQSQIHLIPADGGEARPLTSMKGSFGAIQWAPDGRRLVCGFQKADADEIERRDDEAKKKLGVVVRHYDRAWFKHDGVGYLRKERWHIWSVDARSGKADQLTDHDVWDEEYPTISPDGTRIAFVSNHQPEPDLEPETTDLFIMPIGGGDAVKIDTPLGSKSTPMFSPDGNTIAYYAREGREWWRHNDLFVVPADGGRPARNLTTRHDRNVSAFTLGDMIGPDLMSPMWTTDGTGIYAQFSQIGNTTLERVDVATGEMHVVIAGPGTVAAFDLDTRQRTLCWFAIGIDNTGQLWTKEMETQKDRRLTRVNESLLRGIDLGKTTEEWVTTADGTRIQGWILTPPRFDPSKEYPSILEIHGGPRGQYGHNFMHEFAYLAAKGYVVYYCNPRGSIGYGEEFSKAITNNWGTVDYDDVMAWADHVSKKPFIDTARMGVTGGSYGGYMTAWIIGHSDRFRAAVTQRCVSNLVSMWGSSDGNWIFQREFGDTAPHEDLDNFWRQSPMKHIGNAKTPTLVIHSEMDMRCAIEQGEQVFVALKRLGVPTEMVRFPDEPHGLSRGGRTDRRIERLNHILRWFDRYMEK